MLSLMPRTTNYGLSIFDDFYNDPFFKRSTTPKSAFASTMKTDIQEKDGLYLLAMDLPGYNKEDIKAELKDGYLTISASKNEENETKDESGYVMRERYTGSCSRSFYVGDHVTEENIKAAYDNGILNLSFPKEPAVKEPEVKLIDIQ